MSRLNYTAPLALLALGATSANAGLLSAEMYEVVGDPSVLWGAPLASLDVNTETGYNWANPGYEVQFPNGLGQDVTDLTSRMYNVPSAMVLDQGGDQLTLNPGDRVFAYTMTLVEASASTIQSIEEFQVGNFGDPTDGSLIKGRGFISTGGAVQSPVGGDPGDFSDLGFLWSHDWQWGPEVANQLQNEQTITVLLFTGPAIATQGIGVMGNLPGQVPGVSGSSNIPVLVPTIPTPGAAAIGVIAGVLCTRRSRREA